MPTLRIDASIIESAKQFNIPAEPGPAKTVAFRLTNFAELELPANSDDAIGTRLNLSLIEFDLSNNTRGSAFAAPKSGVYHFDARLNLSPTITDFDKYLRFALMLSKESGTIIERTDLMNPQTAFTPLHTLSISTNIALYAGDVVSVFYSGDAQPGANSVRGVRGSFSGFLVAPFPGPLSAPSGIR